MVVRDHKQLKITATNKKTIKKSRLHQLTGWVNRDALVIDPPGSPQFRSVDRSRIG